MGFVFLEGFDYYWNAQATPNGAQAQWVKGFLDQQLEMGRYGGLCLRHTRAGGTENILSNFPDGDITTGLITVGFAFRCSNLITRQIMILNPSGSTTEQFSIWQHADGSFSVRNGGTTLATSAAAQHVIDTWYYLEIAVTVANSGSFELRLNNTNIVSGSGDTMGAANANTGRITLPEPTTSGTMWYDDMYVRDDLTFIGPSQIFYRRALAPVSGGDFNLTATSAYIYATLVGDQAADTVSYVTGGTVGHEQFWTMESLLRQSGTTVHCISLLCFARTDAGTATLDPVVQSNGDETVGTSWALDTTFRFRRRIFSLDPDTAGAWSRAALAASNGGVRINALAGGAAQVQISQLGYQVLVPVGDAFNVSGGHRYWSVLPLTWNGGSRPGSFLHDFVTADGERLRPVALTSDTVWTTGNTAFFAADGRKDTVYIGGNGPYRYYADFGGPVIPKKFLLGAQSALVNESYRTFQIDYSDDGVTWTTLYTRSTPETGWSSTEFREFTLPDLTPPAGGRRRQTLVLN
jgi:hypothetical protein